MPGGNHFELASRSLLSWTCFLGARREGLWGIEGHGAPPGCVQAHWGDRLCRQCWVHRWVCTVGIGCRKPDGHAEVGEPQRQPGFAKAGQMCGQGCEQNRGQRGWAEAEKAWWWELPVVGGAETPGEQLRMLWRGPGHWQWQRERRRPVWGTGAEVGICKGQGCLSSSHDHGGLSTVSKTCFHVLDSIGSEMWDPVAPLGSMVKGVSGRGRRNDHCSEWPARDTSPDFLSAHHRSGLYSVL